ncbi:helix-turn-helix domain-containing protein [Streptomyces xanthophaeus]|uniref:helix-turn-helix domain-containing protein n=1 Tax=Streptomyces xanthophaeus TaxID=67385 RepID=UPI003864C9A0|nr:helix-turn-helix domain-containing protein [Streptomyces xanthophaeus]WST62126.1 helix-turn-helix domain-containing protein [Streptomyces xanthophaeus]
MPYTLPPDRVLARRRVIGARIRAARTDAGLTQEALAEAAGIDNKTVHRIEYATSDPTLTTLLRIAVAVGVPLAELVRD